MGTAEVLAPKNVMSAKPTWVASGQASFRRVSRELQVGVAVGSPTKPGGSSTSTVFAFSKDPGVPLTTEGRARLLNSMVVDASAGCPPAWVNGSPFGSRTSPSKAAIPKPGGSGAITVASRTLAGEAAPPPEISKLLVRTPDAPVATLVWSTMSASSPESRTPVFVHVTTLAPAAPGHENSDPTGSPGLRIPAPLTPVMPAGKVALRVACTPVTGSGAVGTSPTFLTRTRYWCVLPGAAW